MASNARRPLSAPRPNKIRTALPAGLLAAAAIALVAVLVFGLIGRGNHTVGPSPSSSASPTSPTASASAIPTESPTPQATPAVIEATVLARVPDCQAVLRWSYAISGNDLYLICYDTNSRPYVARIDLTTNKLKAKYGAGLQVSYFESVAVVDDSLWFDVSAASACGGNCDGQRRLERFDAASGKKTLELRNVELVGSASGYVWVRDLNAADASPKPELRKLDPRTGQEQGRIAFAVERAQLACGSLWGLATANPGTADEATTVTRVDPADGTVQASFTEPGVVDSLQSVGSQCWARVYPVGDASAAAYADHFVEIGQSGTEARSPSLAPANQGDAAWTSVAILGDSFWLASEPNGEATATLQRLDPATWQPTGPTWRCDSAGYFGDKFAGIGGSAWTFDNEFGLSRLAIPLGS